jgi:pimeloyl-ACP methyl ester carboxylesterase
MAGLLLLFPSSQVNAARTNPETPAPAKGDYVVLLHGLGRSAWSMKRLEWALAREGYRVVNVSYPSTRLSVEDAASVSLAGILREHVEDHDVKVHFVTHSLGGIVLRQYLAGQSLTNLGRVVMLAPPNQGSELVDKLRRNGLFRFVTGPAGQQLGTDAAALPKRLGPAEFDLGIIAGNRSLNPLFSAWLPGPDDGKVSVASTKLEGMEDFLAVPCSHTWLPWRGSVTRAVAQFLARGRFSPEDPQIQ